MTIMALKQKYYQLGQTKMSGQLLTLYELYPVLPYFQDGAPKKCICGGTLEYSRNPNLTLLYLI